MLYCNRCGQCIHISDDAFIGFYHVSGWESQYLDPETGESYEYKDGETTETDDDGAECGHCQSSDIDWDSAVTAVEARAQRTIYDTAQRLARGTNMDIAEAMQMAKEPDWD